VSTPATPSLSFANADNTLDVASNNYKLHKPQIPISNELDKLKEPNLCLPYRTPSIYPRLIHPRGIHGLLHSALPNMHLFGTFESRDWGGRIDDVDYSLRISVSRLED
jgi:hypothetical protein